MRTNSLSEAAVPVYVTERVVDGATLTYDQAGKIIKTSDGLVTSLEPFTKLLIKWDKPNEDWRRVLSVSAGNKIHLDVEGKKYKIKVDGTFKRTPQKQSGKVNELLIKDEANADGEKFVDHILPEPDSDEDQILILAHASPGCRYKLNQATGQWQRVC